MCSLLFDFDGTLFDTEAGHEAAYLKTFQEFNLGECPPYESLKGIKTMEVFARYQSVFQDTHKLAQYKSASYQTNLDQVKTLVDFNLLAQLIQKDFKLYIVTGGSRKSIDALLDLHQVRDLFQGIVTAEDYGASKPDPEPFLHGIRTYDIQGEVQGIEDSIQGIQSLKAAQVRAVGVHNPAIESISDVYYPSINTFLTELIQTR
jgi:HAD superfamily hydrolase (TIGR01509 family)